jgi:hypothetical protein
MNTNEVEEAINEGNAIVDRLLIDIVIARSSWAHLSALHLSYGSPNSKFKDQLQQLALSARLFSLADALIRDTLMALYRMTDAEAAGPANPLPGIEASIRSRGSERKNRFP